MSTWPPRLRAYPTTRTGEALMEVVPAPHLRERMPDHARRCLPMTLANQAGWWILNPGKIWLHWDGAAGADGVTWGGTDKRRPAWVGSHFGSGIVTFIIPYLFRTDPGWNLLVRGPANHVKAGIQSLEGLVETDWSPATFTMNWKFTDHSRTVHFEEGEPLCQIVPQRRYELEEMQPEILPMPADERVTFEAWARGREEFNDRLAVGEPTARRQGWQKDYARGNIEDVKAREHQARLKLRHFENLIEDQPGP